MIRDSRSGFTLAELLISLAILGVIATFTIPKILQAQQTSQKTALSKEAASIISGAFQQYQFNNGITSSTKISDLTQYMNYVSVDTTSTVDEGGGFTVSCTAFQCLKLHNGGTLIYKGAESFSGTNTTNGVWFAFDPDGTANSSLGVSFVITYNGRITSCDKITTSIVSSIYTYTTGASTSWFQW